MLKIHEFFLTFFYFGKAKRAPGTVGSLASILFWFLLTKFFVSQDISIGLQTGFWLGFLILCFAYGCYASPIYAKQFGEMDHKTIVLDETVGQILPLQATFFLIHENYFSSLTTMSAHLFFCFALFRLLDITKPSFIGYCDRTLKNGFGVMFDDLLCGLITAALGIIFILAN